MALLVDHFLSRSLAAAFYLTGGVVLALAVLTSAPVKPGASPGRGGMPYGDQGEREATVRRSFSYMLVGGLLIALGVVLEALG